MDDETVVSYHKSLLQKKESSLPALPSRGLLLLRNIDRYMRDKQKIIKNQAVATKKRVW